MIYLDANAHSQLRDEARALLTRVAAGTLVLGNASSVHAHGRAARALLTVARKNLLSLLSNGEALNATLFFTSGGTESCNALVKGFVESAHAKHSHIICSAIEHPAVLEPLRELEQNGAAVTRIAPAADGVVRVEDFVAALRDETVLVVLMAANNETGAIQPVAKLAETLRSNSYRGAIVCDISQALCKTELDVNELFESGVDAVALSGHKLGALSGVGAIAFCPPKLQRERCVIFSPTMVGGPQENRFRAGTENLLGAVVLGEVAKALKVEAAGQIARWRELREVFLKLLLQALPDLDILSPVDPARCLSNTLMLRVAGCRSDDLVVALDLAGVAASTGSACASGKQEISHVLVAMRVSETAAREAIRFSLDWDSSIESVTSAVAIITQVVLRMRRENELAAAIPLAVGGLGV